MGTFFADLGSARGKGIFKTTTQIQSENSNTLRDITQRPSAPLDEVCAISMHLAARRFVALRVAK